MICIPINLKIQMDHKKFLNSQFIETVQTFYVTMNSRRVTVYPKVELDTLAYILI